MSRYIKLCGICPTCFVIIDKLILIKLKNELFSLTIKYFHFYREIDILYNEQKDFAIFPPAETGGLSHMPSSQSGSPFGRPS